MNKVVKKLGWSLFPRHFFRVHFRNYKWAKWTEREQAIIPLFLSKKTECIDIGANHGRYTALMSIFSRHVHAFEPNPECVTNLEDLCLPNASVYPFALSSLAKTSEFFVPMRDDDEVDDLGTLDRPVLSSFSDIRHYTVETSTLDALRINKPISFVKVDVEGHEIDVLTGGKRLIAEEKPVVMVEAEERHKANAVKNVQEFFENLGYQGFYAIDNTVMPLDSFDDALQNPEELSRPVSFREMRYINNFIFLPDTLEIQSMVEKMKQNLNDERLSWTLM